MINPFKLSAGLFLGMGLLFPGLALSDENYLHIHLSDGQALDAPIQSFKGISLSVLTTLKKQGKLANVSEPASDPHGYMTFVLNPDVSAAFTAWAKSLAGKGPADSATGEFAWAGTQGKTSYVFKMTHLQVVQFTPADSKGLNGGQFVLSADTVSYPPIDFKPKK
jgi:hypothetical protein